MNLFNTSDRKAFNSCIVDCHWKDDRLPWLDKVLLLVFSSFQVFCVVARKDIKSIGTE